MKRVVIAIGVAVGVVLALNAAAEIAETVAGGPEPHGPASSAFATAPEGLAAYAELLERRGHSVRLERDPIADLAPDSQTTLVILDPESISSDDVTAMRAHLDAGGRLVAGGAAPDWIGRVIGPVPVWDPQGVLVATPFVPVDVTAAVGEVHTDGTGSWSDAGPALPVLGSGSRSVVAVTDVGPGVAVLVADTSWLQNRLLGTADNAAMAVALAGDPGRTVRFLESVHGYGPAGGFGAIPTRWRWMLAGLALAAIVWMVTRGRRLGPPEAAARELPPARRDYVDAMAVTLARTKDPAALDPIRETVRDRLARRAGFGPDASPKDIERTARREGLEPDEVAALSGADDVLALGRALARMEGRT